MKKQLRKSQLWLLMLLAMLLGGVNSAWAQKALPYSYDFSVALATEGWTMESCHSSTGIYSGAFRFNYNSNPPQYLISPELETIANTVDVSFIYKAQSTSYTESFQVGYSTTDNATNSFSWDNQVETSNTSDTEYKTTFPEGVKYVAIKYNANNQYFLWIDDFKICKTPTCFTPTGLSTSDLTSSSVTLSWTSDADAWNVQYKKATDTNWTDVSGNITTKPYTLTGLVPGTAYQVRVRTYCDASDQSDWTNAVSFTTDCGTITIDANHSFSEDFSGNDLPICWGTIDSGDKKWKRDYRGYASSGYYGDVYLVMPPMTLSVPSQLVLDNYFDYISYYNGTTAKSSIVISTTGNTAADFTTTLYTFTKDELPSSSTTSLPKEISLYAYTGQTVYIAFKYEGNNDHVWFVDNIRIEQLPACPKPTSLTASNPTWQGATLAWTAGSDETQWQVIYGATGFDPETEGTTINNVTENPYTLTGLNPETSYDVYVKAVKGSDISPVSNKASFTTTERYPAPAGLAISNLTTTSATLTWNAADASSWEVAINTTGDTPTEAGTVVNAATYDFSGLTEETTYFAFVRVKDGDNYSNWSAACEFTPSAYTYLTVNEGTTTNAYVPIYGYFTAAANLGGQFIIPAANLTDVQNKVIKKLTFYSNTAEYDYAEAEFDVCVKEISDATMPSSMYAWDDDSWTTVYSGTIAVVGGKMNIIFTTDYNYNASNLLVGIHKTSTDKSGSNYNVAFYGNNSSSYMSNYAPNGNRQKFQPKTTIGYQEKTGSELKVFDGETELTSPASFDFGLALEGTTHTFTLKNTAATPYVATISSTNLTVSPTEVTPTAEGVTITVTMPAQSITDEVVVITPASESGLEPFTILVSGSIKEAGKFEEDFSGNALPNGWTKTDYSSDYKWTFANGYASAPNYECSLTTPMLSFAAGEKFFIDACNNYSWDASGYVKIQTSADGESFADLQTFSAEADLVYNTMKTFSVTIPSADVKYVRFLAKRSNIDYVYGGEKVAGANFAINTDGSTQDFGSVKANTEAKKTYTITNSGNVDLPVSFTDAADFYVPMTVKFTKPNSWTGDKLFVYAWNNSGELVGAWPGIEVTEAAQNDMSEWVYTAKLPKSATGIKFSDNANNATGDISTDDFKYEVGLWFDGSIHIWENKDFTVAANGTATFTVKMDTKTPGNKSGNIELAFNALNATSFTIPCTGTVLDPNYLIVDFEDNTFPEGWQKGADWAIGSASSNHYAVQSNTTTASALMTTPLTVAEGETLTFKAARNASGQGYVTSLKVRYSVNGGTDWSEYTNYTIESSGLSEMSLTGVPAGTVIVEFLGSNIRLDDIEGFTNTTAPALALIENGTAVANDDTKDFGNLSANGTVVYTLRNIGNAEMKVTVTGENVDVVNSGEIILPVGGAIDLTVSMVYGEPYGQKVGKITIDAEDEWIDNFVVNFTANLVDPSDFVEDFTAGKPAGWYDGGWTFNGETASIAAATAKDLITKKLEAATGKDQLTFKAKYSNENLDKTLNVYTSTDRMNWTLSKEVTLTADFADVTLDALAAGFYYVKFEAANAIIDDVKGLKNVDLPAHDLYMVSSTLPTDAITPFDNYTATVNVASLVAEETVAAELYFGETKVAELTEQTIANGATKAFTLTGNAPAAGEFQVYAKVYNNDVTVETEKVTVSVADKTELTITDFAVVNDHVEADANNEFTAEFTVTVKNTGSTTLTAEQVSVTITDDSNNTRYETETATNALAAGETAIINVSVKANAGNGGEFNFNVEENVSETYWYPNLGDYLTVTVTAAPAIVLNETGDGTFATGENRKVRLNHTFAAGWNTIFLPFATTPDEIATGAKALEFTDYNSTTNELTFSPANELKANTPYAIYVENAITEPIEFTGKTVTASGPIGIVYGDVTFQGIYAPMAAGTVENWYGLTAAGKIAKASATASLKGFRAYFTGIPAGATVRFFDNVSTGISTITVDNNMEGVYNLQGQKVEQLRKGGLYIINGKKTVVK